MTTTKTTQQPDKGSTGGANLQTFKPEKLMKFLKRLLGMSLFEEAEQIYLAPKPSAKIYQVLEVGQTWRGEKAMCPFTEGVSQSVLEDIGWWTATIKEIKEGWVKYSVDWPKGQVMCHPENQFRSLYPHRKP